jgi:HSP20 family protein
MTLVRFARRTPRALTAFTALPGLADVEARLNKLLEGSLEGPFAGDMAPALGFFPPMEISEMADEVLMTVELPGMDRKDIDISVDEGVLIIRGEKIEEKKEESEEKKFYLFERSYGTFQRSFTLPRTVDANKIRGEFDKGVLKVHMPKTAEAMVKGRKIEIAPPK